MKRCPKCKEEAMKVIYMGFPMNLCTPCDHYLFGFWAWILDFVPFNGWFFHYTGAYLPALWYWLTAKEDEFE